MANERHLDILKQGVEVWNRWREENRNIHPDLSRADLRGDFLFSADFSEMDLDGANLLGANLSKAVLTGSDLHRAHLTKANLQGADLSNAILRDAILTLAILREANLTGANLSKAYLLGTDLREANLSEANLEGADLSRTDLSLANLSAASLRGANLSEVNFNKTILSKADFTTAIARGTIFVNIDLSEVKGLETIQHRGPSSIGIDTLERSKGKIPTIFLQGVEFSDTFIKFFASPIIGEAIQYHSCFISYSSKDDAFVQRLYADLQQKGVPCWYAPEDMKIGDKIRPRIDESIRIHDKLLLVLSENSIKSAWVEKEVETAFEEERKRNQTILFPVRLDNAVMETDKAWAADIRRSRHIGDFSRWKEHDVYQQALERLLRDLKAEG